MLNREVGFALNNGRRQPRLAVRKVPIVLKKSFFADD